MGSWRAENDRDRGVTLLHYSVRPLLGIGVVRVEQREEGAGERWRGRASDWDLARHRPQLM